VYAIINDEPLPPDTLRTVLIAMRGGVAITGEAIKEQDRLDVANVFGGAKEKDVVEFDVEDHNFKQFRGAGTVKLSKIDEKGLSDKIVRIKYTLAIELIR